MKRNYFKKSLAILLTLMMIMGTLVMIPLTTGAEDAPVEDVPADTKWIEVGTTEDLKALKSAINAYEGDLAFIRLTADIEVGAHTPINGTNKPVYFDGQNHKLINMTIGSETERAGNTGLFQSVQPGSTIMNVHFVGAKVYGGKTQQSGVLLNDQKNGITVINVSTDETSLIDHTSNRVGGIIGRINGGNSHDTTYIAYCVNNATINSTQDAGGILGSTYGCYNIIFDHCINKGNITTTTAAANQKGLGGIMGRGERGKGATHVTGTAIAFRDCYNVGTLSMKNNNVHQGGISGMIQGYHKDPGGPFGNTVIEFTRCYDYSAREYFNVYDEDGNLIEDVDSKKNPKEKCIDYNRAIASWGDTCQATKYFTDCYGANKADSAAPYPTDAIQHYTACTHAAHNPGENGFLYVAATNGVVVPADGDTNPLDDKIVLSTGETTLAAEMARIDAEFANVYVGMNEYVPYYIADMDDWAAFCALPVPADAAAAKDYYVELKCDLDLSAAPHTPIQVCKYSKLVFNGNHHTITGLNVGTAEARAANAALFYGVGYNSEIHDLHFVGAQIFGSGQMTAVVVNDAYAGLKMTNVSVDSTSLVSGSGNHTAGLVGRIYKGDNTMVNVFENCVNGASVTGPKNVAGIVADMNGNYTLSFKNCINTGALTTTAVSGNIAVGGLFGMHDRGATNPNFAISFENCVNTGSLTLVPAEGSTPSVWAGGIFGCLRGNNPVGGTVLTMKNCFDYSKRELSKATGQYTAIGGLAGNADNDQLNKYLNGNAAANVAGSATPYDKVWGFTISATTIENNYNTVAASTTAEITLAEGVTSTIEAEMNAINNAVVATQVNLGQSGTEADPFVIKKPAQLATLNRYAKGFKGMTLYIKLGADLDLSGSEYTPFDADVAIYFDGAGKTVNGMTITSGNRAGFFYDLVLGSTVKNVIFTNVSITGARFAGVVTGCTQANLTVENVYVAPGSLVSADAHAAGIIGGTKDEKKSVGFYTFKNVVNGADVTAPKTSSSNAVVGGICGYIFQGATTIAFENCINVGTLSNNTSASNANVVVGGILGRTRYDDANNQSMSFTNCVNLGSFVDGVGVQRLGGLAGWIHFGNTSTDPKPLTVTNCFDAGVHAVTGTAVTSFRGLFGDCTEGELSVTVTNSFALTQETSDTLNKVYDNTSLVFGKAADVLVTSGFAATTDADITVTVPAVGETPETTKLTTMADEVNAIRDLACVEGHVWAADCDLECNICGQTRTPVDGSAHSYAADCSEYCKLCGEGYREVHPALHNPANDCDIDCDNCGKILDVVPHANAADCAEVCPDCGEALTPTAQHTFGGDCDTECNVCGATRVATGEHTYENACDAECNGCGATRTPADHVYANDCDASCNECGEERTPADHVYDNACDAKCNECDAERTPAAHVYDDDADTTCNECGATRTVATPDPEEPGDTTKAPDNTTKAPDTEAPEDPGCGGSIAGVGALLALTATFGFAFVGKKKED